MAQEIETKVLDINKISNQTLTDLLSTAKLGKALKTRINDEKNKEEKLRQLSEITSAKVNLPKYYSVENFLPLNKSVDKTLFCFKLSIGNNVEKHYGITNLQFQKILEKKNIKNGNIRITPYRGKILFSMIFIVSEDEIVGECTYDTLYSMTYNLDTKKIIYRFSLKNNNFHGIKNTKIIQKIKNILNSLKVQSNTNIKNNNKIPLGYYEYIESKTSSAITDWNTSSVSNNLISVDSKKEISGTVISITDLIKIENKKGKILVAQKINTNDLVYIRGLSAIILEQCSILSHPAIVIREIGIPLIIDQKATTKYKRNKHITI